MLHFPSNVGFYTDVPVETDSSSFSQFPLIYLCPFFPDLWNENLNPAMHRHNLQHNLLNYSNRM